MGNRSWCGLGFTRQTLLLAATPFWKEADSGEW